MVWQLLAHLSQFDDVVLLTSHTDSGEADDGENVRRCPRKGLLGYLFWLFLMLPREVKARPDVVLLSSAALVGSWVQMVNLRLRRPHVVMVYGTDITYGNCFYQRWLKLLLPRVTALVAISRATRDEVVARGFAEPEQVVVIPPGVDPQIVTLPSTDVPATDRPVLLFVGRVIPRKGLRPFIEQCLPQIQERTPVELWVVGGEASSSLAHSSGELAEIHDWLEGRPEADQIRFLGRVSDEVLRGAFRQAKLIVLPAVPVTGDVEGFGIVFLEAALFGIPAVSTRLGGIPDAVIDGYTGLLTEAGDWRAFADAVVGLLDDSELYSRMSSLAQRRAVEEHAWTQITARYREILASVAPESARLGAKSA